MKFDYVDLYFEINNYILDMILKLLLGIDYVLKSEISNYLKDMSLGLNIIFVVFFWIKFGSVLESKNKLFN